ncbi:MAG: RAMP superfamily CRISPR-associated protein [Planctomycetaceae bacterium]
MSKATAPASATYIRAKIVGELTLQMPVSIGDGNVIRDQDQKGEIATVVRDHRGWPVIPASSLKGVLRSRLTKLNVDPRLIESIFGRESLRSAGGAPSPDTGLGGRFEFRFASVNSSDDEKPDPLFAEQSVAIDRVTRAAADRQLFARQNVSPGTVFCIEIEGFQVTDEEVQCLLSAFDEFNHADNPICLGSGTANDRGRATWQLKSVQTHTRETVGNWLDKSGDASKIWELAKLVAPTSTKLRAVDTESYLLKIGLRLHFDSWFLVRDPKASKAKHSDGEGADEVDAFPLLDASGHVMLRSRGFRGVFRSQFEKIARTLVSDAGGDPNRPGSHVIVETLFGASGAATACRITDFLDGRVSQQWNGTGDMPNALAAGTKTWLGKREFVAIDRFTGGAADKFKFDCVAAWRPVLEGTLSIELNQLRQRFDWWQEQQRSRNQTVRIGHGKRDQNKDDDSANDSEQEPNSSFSVAAVLGLLFLTVRDLVDGDLTFGYGFGKGFGQCRGEVASVAPGNASSLCQLVGISNEKFHSALDRERLRTPSPDMYASLSPEWRAMWQCCLAEARKWASEFATQDKP